MSRARVLASLLAGLAAVSATTRPDAAPVPYTQLVQGEAPAPAAKPRPRKTLRSATPAVRPAMPLQAAAASPGAPAASPVPGPAGGARRPPAPPSPELPLVAAASSAAPAGARLAPGAPLPEAELESFVDGAVRQAMATEPVAGLAVVVVQNGRVLLERGYGLARRSPAVSVDPRGTLFRLGSVSKVFTWIEVLKAVEAGRVRLDAPVGAHLPADLQPPRDGFDAPIRLRNLMAHDAGWEGREFGRLFRSEPLGLDAGLREGRPKRVRAPGDLPTYSSYGAALAGRMVAEGRPFEDVVDADLLRPAGLASTTFAEPESGGEGGGAPMPVAVAARLAVGYAWTRGGFERQPFGFAGGLAPALSASSTADDMARLMLALLGGGRAGGVGAPLWGPRTDAALRTPLTPGWAHGLMVYDLPGGFRGFGHDGAAPGFRARLVTVPQLGLGLFVAGNSDTAGRITSRLPELLVRRFYAGPPPSAPRAGPTQPSDYTGLYVSTRRTYHGLEGFVGRLTRLFTVRAEPDGALAIWGPEGGRRWSPTAKRGRFVAADDTGAPLGFRFASGGRAQAFLDPGGAFGAERVDPLHRPALLAGVAGLAGAAALLALAGLFVRDAREHRQGARELAASRVQSLTSLLWLCALGAFTVWALTGAAEGRLQRDWPNPWLVGASSAALAAALLTVVQLIQLFGVWRGDRRLQGWSGWRKLRHTATVLAFAAFSFVLLGWGALEPWSS